MRYATTFSGIGGWEIGLSACGWELAWQCEKEPYCRTLLTERFGVPICRDIRHLVRWLRAMRDRGFNIMVDALIGSPPCQPFSVAGTQRGTADARHLFPHFHGVICFLRPEWVLMEQVPAILSLHQGKAFEEYIGGLAALGYDLLWHCLPACAAGANHRRDRLWIIAHAHDGPGGTQLGQQQGLWPQVTRGSSTADVAHAHGEQHQGAGASQWRPSTARLLEDDSHAPRRLRQRAASGQGRYAPFLDQIIPDPARELRHRSRYAGAKRRTQSPDLRSLVSDTDRPRLQGRFGPRLPASSRQITAGTDRPFLANDEARWTKAVPAWWLVEPNVGRVADGIPHRVDRLKGLGNAVVPQIPFLIGQAINSTLCLPA